MARVFVGLGSNLGDRLAHLRSALEQMGAVPGVRVLRVSRWIETAPVGGPPQGTFLNGAAELETELPPERVLEHLLRIEQKLGRPDPHPPLEPRAIDLDLLAYDDRLLETPRLTLPHPRMQERAFVLAPLAQIAPDWRHPRLKKTARELLEHLSVAGR